jgi:PhnB protein
MQKQGGIPSVTACLAEGRERSERTNGITAGDTRDTTPGKRSTMAVNPIPDGYHTVTPYLVVPEAARLIDFLKQAFDAQESVRMASPDGRVMHAEVRIGDSVVMIGDAGEGSPARTCMIHLYVPDADATITHFVGTRRALQAGAAAVRELANQFYGDRSGGVRDPWGNDWWVATHVEDVPPEELKKRADAVIQQQASG